MAVKASAHITLSLVVEIEAYYRYYLLQSSTLSAPSVPTTNPPSSSWDDTEPTYTAGSTNSLYFVDLTVFSDGTWSYSEVSLSSSYEAAKEAYNKAANTESNLANNYYTKTETDAQINVTKESITSTVSATYVTKTTFDNLEVGGRNLILNSGHTLGNTYLNWYQSTVTEHTDEVVEEVEAASGYARHIVYATETAHGPWYGGWHYADRGIPAGTYTQRCKMKATSEISVVWGKEGIERQTATVTTEWQTFEFTTTVANDLPSANNGASFYPNSVPAGTEFWIADYKMEHGNIATTWTPAPEDVNADIDATQDVTSELRGDLGTLQSDLTSTQSDVISLQNDQATTLELVSKNTEKITELAQTASGWEYGFATIETSIQKLNDQIVEDKDAQYKYIRFIDGEIWIGKLPEEGEDDLQLVMRNDRISFLLNNVEIAYFSDDALYVTNIHVTNGLRIDNWEFAVRSNGNLGLRWVGE